MRAPHFWFEPPSRPSWKTWALTPLSALYARATAKRVSRKGKALSAAVICVGNINAGGTGKTPTVIALAQHLSERGKVVHVVSRGYGGKLSGPIQVDPTVHTASQVGDEPLLIAAFAPCWVAKDRLQGAEKAIAGGAEIILLDDGFQNPAMIKDMSIVVVDAEKGFGNGRVIPAGPLREPVPVGLARADLVLSIGSDEAHARFETLWGASLACPHIKGCLHPLQTGMTWDGTNVIAFAGIGHPDKFFKTLRNEGVKIIRSVALSDHQPLSAALMNRLENEAKQHNAQLVTTEKDAVRLPPEFRQRVIAFPVRLEVENWGPLDAALKHLFSGEA